MIHVMIFCLGSVRNVAYFFLFFTFFLFGCGIVIADEKNFVKINDAVFSLEIADLPQTRQQGLMHRKTLASDHGMLFVFDEVSKHSFWMKDTLIPLKIIWISDDLRVVDVQNASPCVQTPCRVYEPKSEAKFVLEVNKNVLEDLERGDLVQFLKNKNQ